MAGKPLSFILPSYFLLLPFHLQILMIYPRTNMLEVSSRSQPQRLANSDPSECRNSAGSNKAEVFPSFHPIKYVHRRDQSYFFVIFLADREQALPNANAATSHHHQPRKPVSVTGQISQHSSFCIGFGAVVGIAWPLYYLPEYHCTVCSCC